MAIHDRRPLDPLAPPALDATAPASRLPPAYPGGYAWRRRPDWSYSRLALRDLTAAAGLLALAVLLRLPSFLQSVIDPDESLYVLQAREWLRGGWPYVAVWDMHPVGAPALVAAGFAILGESIAAVRLLGAAAVAVTGFLLFRTVVLARGDRLTGLAAGVLYVAHSLLPGGLATNTEILMAPLVVGGWMLAIIAVRDMQERRRAPTAMLVMGMGLCFGGALWIKQVAAPQACLAFAAVVALALASRLMSLRRLLLLALVFALACGLPSLATGLVYALRGTFGLFYEANVVAPLRYAAGGGLPSVVSLRLIVAAMLQAAWLLALAAVAVGMALRGRALTGWRQDALLPFAAAVWLAGAVMSIVLPAKFFDHYFMLWFPPLCLAAAAGLRGILNVEARRPRLALVAAVLLLASMPVLGDFTARARNGFALRLPDPSEVVAATIRQSLPPGETAFLVNYEPIVYFLADIPLPTRMPFWEHLVGDFSNALGQDSDEELAAVLERRPYLIVISARQWMRVRPDAKRLLEATLAVAYGGPERVLDGVGEVEIWHRR
ncbi:glycosyltransferase family 39 protein [Paeniroseomonas aquatica]|uniref:Glycosyltransferase family 39 protein n=1 Tax=Paeniroseomonas aquatica TaxID=373043 RepID=A0ABT8AEQ5_9PROT|nr:glycosyltransferase family 39 protein [Paeniroseomonas aquatica]MDN3568046.1 glycosyltransferase family 39 protein [Paeniroseomonas aquatica]